MLQTAIMWAILGLVLLGAEMLTGTLYIVWFGLAALATALLAWLIPSLSHATLTLLFAVLSLVLLGVWKQYDKKTAKPALRVGQAQGEEIGRIGTITEAVSITQNGRIQFAQGVMGSRDWVAIADEAIAIEQQAEIISIEGNRLRVKAI